MHVKSKILGTCFFPKETRLWQYAHITKKLRVAGGYRELGGSEVWGGVTNRESGAKLDLPEN